MRHLIAVVLATASLLSPALAPAAWAQAAPAQAAPAGPPPLSAYAALPAISNVTVSPDGSTLAYVRRDAQGNRVIAQTRTGEVLAAVDTGVLTISSLQWLSPDHVAVSSITTEHFPLGWFKGNFRVVDILNVRTRGYQRALRRADHNAYSSVFQLSRGVYNGRPVAWAVAPTFENGDLTMDVYRVDLDTGRGIRETRGEVGDTLGYVLTPEGQAVAKLAYQSDNGLYRVSARTGTGWRQIFSQRAPLDEPATHGLGRTTDSIIVESHTAEDGWVTRELALADGSVRQTFDPGRQINAFDHARDGRLVATGSMGLMQEYEIFDPTLKAAYDKLKATFPEGMQLTIADYSDDMSVVIMFAEGPGETGAYYLYDANTQRLSVVGRAHPGVPGAVAGEVRMVQYTAADGRQLMGYLTLPPGRDPRNLPVVMMPHGGPQSRDEPGFDWLAQGIASRGYAVFQPQFRGSEGYGDDLLTAGYGEWGRKMQSDISDGLRYLAGRGTVDASRACIVGWSYGGYAALAGMTLEAGTYRCGVSIAGVSDLRAMLREEERQGGSRGDQNSAIRYWKRFMGTTGSADASLDERSPARRVTSATGPILLIHGREDTVVPFNQSELMLAAVGGESETAHLIAIPGQGHSLSDHGAGERLQMLQATTDFLAKYNPPN